MKRTEKVIRCAIYTRKSVDEGLDQDLNSLTVQRDAAEAYIASQQGEGWKCLTAQYDDGGYSGGNMERPALRRLLDDIKANMIDCVVVYKVDRLSRSLLDFAKLSELFETHGVSFVSVTQQINTGTSMGKLMLNVLLSFAQFEREIIAERTRDRMAAARRKGRWIGGNPFLGYDVAPEGRALLVNEVEARQVRRIFQIYLDHESLSAAVAELRRQNLRMKRWITRDGREAGGSQFTKSGLHGLLTNVAYVGKVSYKGEIIDGVQDAIVENDLFERVQQLLRRNDRSGGSRVRNKHDALLRGLLTCRHCGTAMTHSFTTKKSGKVYRYYVCQRAMKESWSVCPTKSVPAGEIETFVVDRLRALGSDAELQGEVIDTFVSEIARKRSDLETQISRLEREHRQIRQRIQQAVERKANAASFSLLGEQSQANDEALKDARAQLARMDRHSFEEKDVARALSLFYPVWEKLNTLERCNLLEHLIERISYDGEAGELEIIWKETGVHALLEQ